MSRRKIYDVMPAGGVTPSGKGWWKVVYKVADYYPTKGAAVQAARLVARATRREGELTQVRVRNEKGRIQYENTYGKDPKRYKG